MKVTEFIELANVENNVVDLIEVKKYIPSTEKTRVAEETVESSIEYDDGFVRFDSYKKHLSFIFNVIESHTDLRFSENWENKLQEYDLLYEAEMLDLVIDTFRKDYEESLSVLNMLCEDIIADNSVEASIAKLVSNLSDNLDMISVTLSDKIKDCDIEKIIPSDLDLNKLMKLLNIFK